MVISVHYTAHLLCKNQGPEAEGKVHSHAQLDHPSRHFLRCQSLPVPYHLGQGGGS